jgi:Ca2+-binding RTX toxin-like protein
MSYLVNSGGKLLLVGTVDSDTLDATFGSDSTLIGQAGDDLYVVDSVSDIVVEDAGGGTDTVRSSASYALTPNVENLVLTGSAYIDGTGNELNNSLTGNDGNNL